MRATSPTLVELSTSGVILLAFNQFLGKPVPTAKDEDVVLASYIEDVMEKDTWIIKLYNYNRFESQREHSVFSMRIFIVIVLLS